MNVLDLQGLSVTVENRTVLEEISLFLGESETYMVFGPNGGGKTSLMYALMGDPKYRITKGKASFMGHDLTRLNIYERANLGIGLSVQHPPVINGVTLGDMLRHCLGKTPDYSFMGSEKKLIEDFQMEELLDRKLNLGFSGGERKRGEILQVIFQRPRLMLLDEPDSGVDVESLTIIAKAIQGYLDESNASAMVITHKGTIMDFIQADKACIILDGRLHCFNDPKSIFNEIKARGYSHCVNCNKTMRRGLR